MWRKVISAKKFEKHLTSNIVENSWTYIDNKKGIHYVFDAEKMQHFVCCLGFYVIVYKGDADTYVSYYDNGFVWEEWMFKKKLFNFSKRSCKA